MASKKNFRLWLKTTNNNMEDASKNYNWSKKLDNLIKLGVDHIDIQVNQKVESEFMLETFIKAGSTAIPMHLLFSIYLLLLQKNFLFL